MSLKDRENKVVHKKKERWDGKGGGARRKNEQTKKFLKNFFQPTPTAGCQGSLPLGNAWKVFKSDNPLPRQGQREWDLQVSNQQTGGTGSFSLLNMGGHAGKECLSGVQLTGQFTELTHQSCEPPCPIKWWAMVPVTQDGDPNQSKAKSRIRKEDACPAKPRRSHTLQTTPFCRCSSAQAQADTVGVPQPLVPGQCRHENQQKRQQHT